MFFGSVGRFEAQFLSDLGTCGRETVVFQATLDERENFGLAWRQFQHVGCSGFLYSDWDYIQYWISFKPHVARKVARPLPEARRALFSNGDRPVTEP